MLDYSPFIRRIVFPLCLVVFGLSVHGQQVDRSNPFDLIYRLDKKSVEKTHDRGADIRPTDSPVKEETTPAVSPEQSEETVDTSKRIAVEEGPVVSPAPEEEAAVKPDSPRARKLPDLNEVIPVRTQQPLDQSRTLLFVFFVFQLILLTFSVSLERGEVHRLLRAMANDNYLNLVHRDLKGEFPLQYWIFYFIFISQLSLFLWLCFQHGFINGRMLSFWICLLAVSGIYVTRHIGMKLIAYIFPVEREANQFNFTIAVFNMLLGLFLLPVNAFIAFAAPAVAQFCFYIGLVLILGFYVLRQLRGLFIASEYVMFHRIHFFLYLCTVEIAPVVILMKFFFML